VIYLKETFKYLKRAFFPLLVVAVVPALLLGIFTSPFTFISFLPLYYRSYYGIDFAMVFWMFMYRTSVTRIFPFIITFLGLMIFLSYGLGLVEKQFKTGKRGLTKPLRAINNSALAIFKTVPFMLVVLLAALFLHAGLVTLIRHAISGLNYPPLFIDSFLVTIVSIVVFALVLMASIFVGVWAVVIQIYGYTFKEAFVEAFRAVRKKWFPLFLGLFIPITVLTMAQLVYTAFLVFEGVHSGFAWLQGFVSVMINLFILIYYMAYIPVSVYQLNGLDRRDNKPPYLRGFR